MSIYLFNIFLFIFFYLFIYLFKIFGTKDNNHFTIISNFYFSFLQNHLTNFYSLWNHQITRLKEE